MGPVGRVPSKNWETWDQYHLVPQLSWLDVTFFDVIVTALWIKKLKLKLAFRSHGLFTFSTASISKCVSVAPYRRCSQLLYTGLIDWLSRVSRQHQHNIGCTADSFTGLMTQPTVSKHWRRVVSHSDRPQSNQAHLTVLQYNMHADIIQENNLTHTK